MDTLQYVYSSSESSDDDDVVHSHKDALPQSSSSSKKLNDLVTGYNSGRRKSPPSDRRGQSDKRHSSPDPGRGRSQESRSVASPDSRKDRRSSDRHSPSHRYKSHRRRRSHRDDFGRVRLRKYSERRDRSREHRHDRRSRSRSPRRSHRDSPKRKSVERSRSRSPPHRKPFDAKNKLYILTKMGIDYKGTESVDFPNRPGSGASSAAGSGASVPQYYNPLTINAGKYAEQIAKRKLLWNSKKAEKEEVAQTGSSIWQGAKFSQDLDGKLAAKFQRLMGIKHQGGDGASASGQEIIKKQEELFSSMEMQYESRVWRLEPTMGRVAQSIFIVSLLYVGSIFSTESTGWLVEYLTDLSSVLKDGYPGAGIPKVDPLPINTKFAIASEIFSGDVALQGELSGFSNYFVSKAVLNPNLVVELDLIFLSTTFDGSYSLDASLYKNVVPLSGSGPINIYFSFIELYANCTLVGKNEMLQIKDFDFLIKQINAVQVTANGMLKEYGLDLVLAPALKGVLNTIIKVFKPNLEDAMNNFVMSNGNMLLRQVTISKVLELIKEMVNNSSHGTITITSASMNNLKKNTGLQNVTRESFKKMWELYPQMLLKQTSFQ
ncbi:hypothetical protein GE061_018224 [Apolygus lucorum]|uniref:Small acidic protein-like domain-containing protein n=1 Tax=Apolygus lucorum TaxID=248454 RepID=A0A6A4JDU5_APOLU|nr:hypothetical protein GE061_018224 [Apolygus lucorum]